MTEELEPNEQIHYGAFFGWFETGLEGLVWALQSDTDDSMEGLIVIEALDRVEIRSESGDICFRGEIKPDYEAGIPPPEQDLVRRQPQALGYWIHWTQEGFEPENWARFFVPGKRYVGYVKK